jgi:hypothetical protein
MCYDLHGEFHLNKKLSEEDEEDDIFSNSNWAPNSDGTGIERYDSTEFDIGEVSDLQSLIDDFLKPRGYVLNGTATWHGECHDEDGVIIVRDNVITQKRLRLVDDEGKFYS